MLLRHKTIDIDIPGYRIIRQIGRGGMATVYLAIQTNFEREVALKIMSSSLSEDGSFSDRFLREARIVSRLVHPHIVTVHDVGIHNGHHYLSMEYISGQDLKQRLPTLNGEQVFRVIREVASALDYAGKKGYVHRDVKPENIMINAEDGRAVLMDFGIARAADSSSTMTRTGTALGTPHYMSPEQAKGDPIDGRSDIYSLGVLLYFMLTGKVPFEADSAVAVGIKHLTSPIPSLPDALSIYQPLINTLMAKKPEDRYQSGYDVIIALDQFDPQFVDQWRPQQDAEYLASREYTPIRTEQVSLDDTAPSVRSSVASYLPSGPNSLAETSRPSTRHTPGNAQKKPPDDAQSLQRQGPQVREAITIPKEDLKERTLAPPRKSSNMFWLIVFVLVASATAAGYYYKDTLFETAVYQQFAAALGLGGDEQVAADEQGAITQEQVTDGSRETLTEVGVGADTQDLADVVETELDKHAEEDLSPEVQSQTQALAPGDDIAGIQTVSERTQLELLVQRSEQLAATVEADPGSLPELISVYRQILELQADMDNVKQALEQIKSNELAKVAAQLDGGDHDAASQRLSDVIVWFPQLREDSQYLELDKRAREVVQINALLAKAQDYLNRDRLIRPPNDNARDTFVKVLALSPSNEYAQKGLQRIKQRYLQLAKAAWSKRDNQKALTLIGSGLSVDSAYKPLLDLQQQIKDQVDREQNIASLLVQAQIMESEQQLFGNKQSAAAIYQSVLSIEPQQIDARQSLEQLIQRLFMQVDSLVDEQDYQQAIDLMRSALQSLPGNKRIQNKLQQLNDNKPAIDNLLLSGQPITAANAVLADKIEADRTLHVAFRYKGLQQQGATVLQALLFDGARSVQIAAVPVVVMGDSGDTQFRVDRPVEGFTDGGYHLDILLAGKRIFTRSFVIAK